MSLKTNGSVDLWLNARRGVSFCWLCSIVLFCFKWEFYCEYVCESFVGRLGVSLCARVIRLKLGEGVVIL